MAPWKCAAIVGALGMSATAQAQDGVDWGGLMQTEAMGSAMEEAAREGSRETGRSNTRTSSANPKTQANCAKARRWLADGVRDARLPRVIKLCAQLGY